MVQGCRRFAANAKRVKNIEFSRFFKNNFAGIRVLMSPAPAFDEWFTHFACFDSGLQTRIQGPVSQNTGPDVPGCGARFPSMRSQIPDWGHCFCTNSGRFSFPKLSLRPRTYFFALFSKMKVPGPDSLIFNNFLWIFMPASRPAGPAGPTRPNPVNGLAQPLV